MAIELYQFMSEQSLAIFVNQILTKTNARLDERIVQALSSTSSDKQSLSAKALYDLINTLNDADANFSSHVDTNAETLAANAETIAGIQTHQNEQDEKLTASETSLIDASNRVGTFTHLTLQTVTGPITSITEPREDILYLQRDNDQDTTWMMYIYHVFGSEHVWIPVGDTELDLSGIWSKDEADELREALGIHLVEPVSEVDITEAVEDAFNNNAVDYRMEPEGEPIIPSEVEYGTALSDVPIEGTMIYDGVEVPGTFSWETTDEEFAAAVEAAPEV